MSLSVEDCLELSLESDDDSLRRSELKIGVGIDDWLSRLSLTLEISRKS